MKILLILLVNILLLSCGNRNKQITNVSDKRNDSIVSELEKEFENEQKSQPINEGRDFKQELVDTLGNCEKCNIQYIVDLDNELQNLAEEKIYLFFCTFSPLCASNVEFGEYGNEMLFKILETNASLFLEVLSKNKNSIHLDIIMKELASPINDLIDIEAIKKNIKRINGADVDVNMKEKVLRALSDTD